MALLRVSANGEELDLSRKPRTAFGDGQGLFYLYKVNSVKMPNCRGRSGQVKVYSKEEIQEYERRLKS